MKTKKQVLSESMQSLFEAEQELARVRKEHPERAHGLLKHPIPQYRTTKSGKRICWGYAMTRGVVARMRKTAHFTGKASIESALAKTQKELIRVIKSKASSHRVPHNVREKLTKIRRLWKSKNQLQRRAQCLQSEYDRSADKLIRTYPALLETDVPHLAQIRADAGRKNIRSAWSAAMCIRSQQSALIPRQPPTKRYPIFPGTGPTPCASRHNHIRKYPVQRRAANPSLSRE